MRDFFDAEAQKRLYLIRRVSSLYEAAGFRPLLTPALERYSVLTKKGVGGIAGEIFKIENADIALRFDLTVPLVRFYAEHRDLKLPLMRYQIQPVWRREEPQRKRYREFLQADIDIIGGKEPWADIYVIETLLRVLDDLGVEVSAVLLNSRRALVDVPDEVLRLVDKLDKQSLERVRAEADEKGLRKQFDEFLKSTPAYSDTFYAIVDHLKARGWPVRIEKTMVRGLNYYSGVIFEVKMKGESLTIAAGGRYDRLLKIFGINSVGAVGGSIGIERIFETIEWRAPRPVFVAWKDVYDYALEVARKLGVAVFPDNNLKKALAYVKENDRVIIVGPREKERRTYIEKDLRTGEQVERPLD